MKNEQKAIEIANDQKLRSYSFEDIYSCVFEGCLEMAEWKDEQLKQTLIRFFKYLDKRGFLDKDLQYDPEHQIDTFLSQFNKPIENNT